MKFAPSLLAASLAACFSVSLQAAPPLSTPVQEIGSIEYQAANAWLEIDQAAFEHNIQTLKKQLNGQSQICFIMKGDAYGHGIANLPMGYSDGYRRIFTNNAHVLVNGQRAPVVGKVSMNTTMVDVTNIQGVKPGDEVVLFGKQGAAEITQGELENANSALLADLYTVWGNSNPKILKRTQ